jgi:ribokinase
MANPFSKLTTTSRHSKGGAVALVVAEGTLACDEVLVREGVDTTMLETEKSQSSGIALIDVVPSGENRILIIPGTNGRVDRAQIDRVLPEVRHGDFALFQLEIPLDTVRYALRPTRVRPGFCRLPSCRVKPARTRQRGH